jgi:glyoxylase-like metal-dependent hydrolase (beta-lactamase superfamily II)
VTHPLYEALRAVTPLASVLLARNPSPMTLEGTNTWVLRAPGVEECVVIDPGDEDEEHLKLVAAHGPVALVLLTHRHHDHAGGARTFAELTGAPVRALDRSLVLGSEALGDGDVVAAAGVELRVVHTPGHTSDSLSFLLDGPTEGPLTGPGIGTSPGPVVLTGDTILGRGTTVIAHPDGTLGPYLDSLRRLADLAPGTVVLPGHGPELPDASAVAAAYLAHREQRLEQVRDALTQLGPDASARAVVELVYADVDEALWPAAELSVRAQLEHLRV